jgi:proline iminopeptidase
MMKISFFLLTLINVSTFLLGQDALKHGDHFALINGIKLHYYVKGKGPVCLVPSPGWGPSIGYLRSTLQPLENYFTIVYYDTRISGQSAGPVDTTKYRGIDFMDDMDSLRQYLKQEKVWVMGHSGGGFQVLNYGIHHGDHLKGIIALDALAGDDSLRAAELTKGVLKRKAQPYYQKGADILLGKDTTNYSLSESTPLILPFYFHDPSKMNAFIKLDVSPLSEKANQYTNAARLFGENLIPDLGKIGVPTLVVVGDDDFDCDKISQADRIAKNISTSYEIVIKDAGHFCWFEQPSRFFDAVEGWLKKQGVKQQSEAAL